MSRRKVIVTKKRLLKPSTSSTLEHQKSTITENTTEDASIPDTTDIGDVTTENEYSATTQEEPSSQEEDEEESTSSQDEDEEEPWSEDEGEDEKESTSLSSVNTEASLPDYEPFFPELTESFDAPVLLLKTTVLTSTDFETQTVVQTKNRTYTFVVTRVSGDEQFVTSTTEVRPHTKTLTVTQPNVRLTTLTLLDLDATEAIPFVPLTADSSPSPDLGTHVVHSGGES